METTDVRNLVTDALLSLKPPYSEHMIDEVFHAIESPLQISATPHERSLCWLNANSVISRD